MIATEGWAEIGALHRRDSLSEREIARRLGIAQVMVDRALTSDRTPRYPRPAVATSFPRVGPLLRELLLQAPSMPGMVIAERIGLITHLGIRRSVI